MEAGQRQPQGAFQEVLAMDVRVNNKPTCDCEVFAKDLGDEMQKYYYPCEKHKRMLDELSAIDDLFDKGIAFHLHMEDFAKEAVNN